MKLIIIDRDGVINEDSEFYIKNIDELSVIPSSIEAINILTNNGYIVVVCSNQSAIGRGFLKIADLNEINEEIIKLVEQGGGEISAIFICPHTPNDNCACRKPKPKMIYDICERFNIEDIKKIMFVGDSLRDLAAISQANGIPVLVKTGNGKKTLQKGKLPKGTLVFENLLEVSEYLIEKDNEDTHEK